MKKSMLVLISCVLFALSFGGSCFASPGELYARSAVLMDGDSGRILFEKNGEEVLPVASTTKILTCILVLEYLGEEKTSHLETEKGITKEEEVPKPLDLEKINAVAKVSADAVSSPKVRLGVFEGEEYYVTDLLYSLMLESHNDAAVILAEYVSGSVEAFAALMNEKAMSIGCTSSHFVTPNGLDGEDEGGIHGSTAADMALILRYCIGISPQREAFLTITQTREKVFSNIEGNRSFTCTNHNAFLDMMEGALTGKTGFTGNAGYCYTGALTRDGKTFIVALLACGWPNNKDYKWSDTKKLMEYGLAHYEYRQLWREVDDLAIPVTDGIPLSGIPGEEAFVSARTEGEHDFTMLLCEEEAGQVSVLLKYAESLSAPVSKGKQVGKVCYLLNGEIIGQFPITTAEDVKKKDFLWKIRSFIGI